MKYRKGYKYQLAEEITFQINVFPGREIVTKFIRLTTTGLLTIYGGYAWDGPSGPTIDTEDTMTPSLVHDALAQLMRMNLLSSFWRIRSNEILREMMVARAAKWEPLRHAQLVRAAVWKRELDKFGAPSTDPKNVKKVFEVT